MSNEKQEAFEEWLKDRPDAIKEFARKYPPGIYKMKEDSPYGLNPAGTRVHLHSWFENGTHVSVIVLWEDIPEEGIQHLKDLCAKHKKDYSFSEGQNHQVEVEAKYIELIEE